MASKSGELRMALLGVALLGLLLLSQHAAAQEGTEGATTVGATATETAATEGAAAAKSAATGSPPVKGKKMNSFSFNNAGARTLTSFSMNADRGEKKPAVRNV